MNKKLGFIGCGNMAKAMMKGIIASDIAKADEIVASDVHMPSLERAKEDMGICISTDNNEVASSSEILILAVKPQYYSQTIAGIAGSVKEDTIVVSIAPGQTLERLEGMFGKKVKIVRTMPNTPALVCEGITGVCANEMVSAEELDKVCSVLEGFGKAEIVDEKMMDAVVAVSGSSPAYVFMFIEAMADAAVLGGMPRSKAYIFAAQAVLGSAKMVLETGKHPGELKDMVCSPAGTTIEAVKVLEEEGFRSAVMKAMKECMDKSKSMG